MEDSASLITNCVDLALSQLDFVDKSAFYQSLQNNYHVEPREIGSNFETFHEAIKQEFGVKHFRIERLIIRCLHEQTKKSETSRSAEISAFSQVTNIFAAEITENIERNRELANSKEYAKHLEEKVKTYDEKLKSAEHLATIGQTAAMVGHDIRNPLQAIAGDMYLIENDVSSLPSGKAKESLQDSIKDVSENLYYINKIVSDLQDYAKPLNPNLEQISIEKLIETALLIVPIPDNLKVEIKIGPNFTDFNSDFYMVKRALVNLLHNAVQAMPKGGKLTIMANKMKDCIAIEVEDTGEGIPEDVKKKLFTPMFTTKSKGQGFGLVVSKRLIEALHGTLTFESEAGKGSKFTMQLSTNDVNRNV